MVDITAARTAATASPRKSGGKCSPITRRKTSSGSVSPGNSSMPTGAISRIAERIITPYMTVARLSESRALLGSRAVATRITMCGITGMADAQMTK